MTNEHFKSFIAATRAGDLLSFNRDLIIIVEAKEIDERVSGAGWISCDVMCIGRDGDVYDDRCLFSDNELSAIFRADDLHPLCDARRADERV